MNKPDHYVLCAHTQCEVDFNEKEAEAMEKEGVAQGLDEFKIKYAIRKRWPRFQGVCPDCKVTIIKYASTAHYVWGDW